MINYLLIISIYLNEAAIPAPWETVTMQFNYNKALPTKSSTTAETMKKLAEESIQPLGRPVFYTDGSVHKRQAGAGIVQKSLLQKQLHAHTRII